MLIGSLVTAIVVLLLLALLLRKRTSTSGLGRMSDQWLAEHRASHGS
jgi:hypothetical protein